MAKAIVWHRPDCALCTRVVELLEGLGVPHECLPYLEQPPTVDDLKTVCRLAHVTPRELLRTRESRYEELGLRERELDGDALLAVLAENPVLIQRPVVLVGPKACVARPPERVLTLFIPKMPADLDVGLPKGLSF